MPAVMRRRAPLSAEAREKIADAQRRRWARIKGSAGGNPATEESPAPERPPDDDEAGRLRAELEQARAEIEALRARQRPARDADAPAPTLAAPRKGSRLNPEQEKLLRDYRVHEAQVERDRAAIEAATHTPFVHETRPFRRFRPPEEITPINARLLPAEDGPPRDGVFDGPGLKATPAVGSVWAQDEDAQTPPAVTESLRESKGSGLPLSVTRPYLTPEKRREYRETSKRRRKQGRPQGGERMAS